ncbi:MAG: hypothetical protein HYY40_06805 [Bacteroidetes bacterium]|nr:hypothetical protein [Bacteroidota bacterium]
MKKYLLSILFVSTGFWVPDISLSQSVTGETKDLITKPANSSDISKEELEQSRKVTVTKKSETIVSRKVRMIPKNRSGQGERVFIIEDADSSHAVTQTSSDENNSNSAPLNEETIIEKDPKQ